MKSKFISSLCAHTDDDKTWVLDKPLIYYSELLNEIIVVPEGFETDFASVPRVPVAFWLFGDRAHHEAVIHDFLYRVGSAPDVSRKVADKVFLEAMRARKKPWYIRTAMYLGVKLAGWTAYHKRELPCSEKPLPEV